MACLLSMGRLGYCISTNCQRRLCQNEIFEKSRQTTYVQTMYVISYLYYWFKLIIFMYSLLKFKDDASTVQCVVCLVCMVSCIYSCTIVGCRVYKVSACISPHSQLTLARTSYTLQWDRSILPPHPSPCSIVAFLTPPPPVSTAL